MWLLVTPSFASIAVDSAPIVDRYRRSTVATCFSASSMRPVHERIARLNDGEQRNHRGQRDHARGTASADTTRNAVEPAANQFSDTSPKCDRNTATGEVSLLERHRERGQARIEHEVDSGEARHRHRPACRRGRWCRTTGRRRTWQKNTCAPIQNAIAGALPLNSNRRAAPRCGRTTSTMLSMRDRHGGRRGTEQQRGGDVERVGHREPGVGDRHAQRKAAGDQREHRKRRSTPRRAASTAARPPTTPTTAAPMSGDAADVDVDRLSGRVCH